MNAKCYDGGCISFTRVLPAKLAVMRRADREGGVDNPAFATRWNALPAEEGPEHTLSAQRRGGDAPRAAHHVPVLRIPATTPPCSEGVKRTAMTRRCRCRAVSPPRSPQMI